MDSNLVQQVVQWVQNNVGERTSKQELMQKAQGSDLPQEAKSSFQDLPEGEHSKQTVIQHIQSKAMSGMGMGGGRGTGGGGMGGMGGM